jgi:hypothetical protein
MDNKMVLLSESFDWMDILEVLASGVIGSRGGDSVKPASSLGAMRTL